MEADKSLNLGPQTHRKISGRQKHKFVILVCIEDEINTLVHLQVIGGPG